MKIFFFFSIFSSFFFSPDKVIVLPVKLTSIFSFFMPGNSALTTMSSRSSKISTDGVTSSISGILNLGHHDGPIKENGLLKTSSNHLSPVSRGEIGFDGSAFTISFVFFFAIAYLLKIQKFIKNVKSLFFLQWPC